MKEIKFEPGTKLYSVATGRIDPLMKVSRDAVAYVKKRPGFMGVNMTPDGQYTLWLFDSLVNAIGAKQLMKFRGIQCGTNISEFEVNSNDEIRFLGVAAGKDKGKGYQNENNN